ncbi:hypothetical protein [Acidocella facilis]|uniref:hypothetical protein n=1 Tax=Acidocella facilis TaxID=525 RepID=UPI001F3DC344|nr:hypothetical protein [Acidocella facilis]
MIDAWTIGANIEINDNILTTLERLYNEFDRVERAVEAINAAFTRTGGLLPSLVGQAQAFAGAFADAARNARSLQRALSDTAIPGGPTAPGAGGAQPAAGPVVPEQYGPTGQGATPNLPAVIPGQGPQGAGGKQPWGWTQIPGYGEGGTPQGPDSAPNDYVPNWAPPQAPDEPFQRPGPVPLYPSQGGGHGFDPVHGYFYGQAVLDIARGAIGAPFEQAANVDQKLAILKANGMTEAQAKDAYGLAFKMQQDPQYRTLDVNTLLGILQATYLQTGEVGEATRIMPDLANAATVLQGIGDGAAKDQMFDLLRSGDLAGLLNKVGPDGKPDLSGLEGFIRTFTAIQLATGGDAIPPSQVLHLFQNAGPSLMGMDQQGMAMTMLLALSLGQQKAGTGINQMYKELVGGKMSIANEKFLESIGLLDPSKIVPGSSHGGYVQMQAGALKDEADFMRDPVAWFAKNVGQEYQNESPEQRQELMHRIYATAGTAQGARVISDSIFQDNMLLRYYMRAQGLPDLPALAQQFNYTPQGSATAAGAATAGLIVTLSNDTMGAFRPMLDFYTSAVNRVAKAAQDDPTGGAMLAGDLGLGIGWAGLKAMEKWIGGSVIGKAAGTGADILKRGAEPLFYVEAAIHDVIGLIDDLKSPDAPWGKDGAQAWKKMFDLGTDPAGAVVKALTDQTHQIVSAIKGEQAGAAPSGPTGYNSSVSPPAPGQALPNHW